LTLNQTICDNIGMNNNKGFETMKICIASHNEHKIKEITQIFKHQNVTLITLKDLNDFDEVIEDGHTFFDNAYLKAYHFAKKYGIPTISDDSGIACEALEGAPGIHSARYSGFGDDGNNQKLIKEMEKYTNRNAKFVCVICYCKPNGEHYFFEGEAKGLIAHQIKGMNGFGYDPLFYDPLRQMTFAELNPHIKNQISHRAKALKKFEEALDEIVNYK
jgi:non-canonical purine NTP pyrophosphatase (RdgB/HAM1 family)